MKLSREVLPVILEYYNTIVTIAEILTDIASELESRYPPDDQTSLTK